MSDMDYDDLLNRSFDDIQEEKILPHGDWLLRLRNAVFMEPKGDTNAKVLFFYHPVQPVELDDDSELEALGDDYDYTENQIVSTFWIEGNRSWREVKAHLVKHAGVKLEGSIRDVLKKGCAGGEVIAELDERTFEAKTGDLMQENVAKRFRPVE